MTPTGAVDPADRSADAATEAGAAAVAAALLAEGRTVHGLSVMLTAAAAAVLPFATWLAAPLALPLALTFVVVAGLAETWLAMRVGLDAALFGRLAAQAGASGPDLTAFDRAMAAARLMPPGKAGRPLAARIGGARRLLVLQGVALALQAAAGLAGAWAAFALGAVG